MRASVILDLIWTKSQEMVVRVKVMRTLGGSDNVLLEFLLMWRTKKVCSHTFMLDTSWADMNKLKRCDENHSMGNTAGRERCK